ncbi:MAG: hypothetical protein O3A63_06735, partial [Proteobacteria bacterium]|nr:hypothetical protein [Pseudomonadota bacterium]
FACELAGFEVTRETLTLMQQMAADGSLDELPAERVWAETVKALKGPDPERYFQVLKEAHALSPWFVELEGPAESVEGKGELIPLRLTDPLERFAAMAWLLDNPQAQTLIDRLKPPNDYSDLMMQTAANTRILMRWRDQTPEDVYRVLTQAGAFRGHARWGHLVEVVSAVGNVDLAGLVQAVNGMNQMQGRDFAAQGFSGLEIGQRLDQARLTGLRQAMGSD